MFLCVFLSPAFAPSAEFFSQLSPGWSSSPGTRSTAPPPPLSRGRARASWHASRPVHQGWFGIWMGRLCCVGSRWEVKKVHWANGPFCSVDRKQLTTGLRPRGEVSCGRPHIVSSPARRSLRMDLFEKSNLFSGVRALPRGNSTIEKPVMEVGPSE